MKTILLVLPFLIWLNLSAQDTLYKHVKNKATVLTINAIYKGSIIELRENEIRLIKSDNQIIDIPINIIEEIHLIDKGMLPLQIFAGFVLGASIEWSILGVKHAEEIMEDDQLLQDMNIIGEIIAFFSGLYFAIEHITEIIISGMIGGIVGLASHKMAISEFNIYGDAISYHSNLDKIQKFIRFKKSIAVE